MNKIIYSINHQLSQNIINKTTTHLDSIIGWYRREMRKSIKEFKGWWYEENYK